jgi:hypothetical protein
MVMAHPPDQARETSLQAVANNTIIGAPTPSHQVGLFTATLSLRAIQPGSLSRGVGGGLDRLTVQPLALAGLALASSRR